MLELRVLATDFPETGERPAFSKWLVTARLLIHGCEQKTYYVFGFEDLDCVKKRIREVARCSDPVKSARAVLSEISCGMFVTGEEEHNVTFVEDFLFKKKQDADCCHSFFLCDAWPRGTKMAAFLSVVRYISEQTTGIDKIKLIDVAEAGSGPDALPLTAFLLAEGRRPYYARFGFRYFFTPEQLAGIADLRCAYKSASSNADKAGIVKRMSGYQPGWYPVLELVKKCDPASVGPDDPLVVKIPHAEWVRSIADEDPSVRMPSEPRRLVQHDDTIQVLPAIPAVQPLVPFPSQDGESRSDEPGSQRRRLACGWHAALPALVRLRL